MILGAESALPHAGDPGLHPERHRGCVDIRPLVRQCRVPAPPPPHLRLGVCSFCVLRAVCSTDPRPPDSSFTCGERPQAGPAHRAATPLSSCLRPLLSTSFLVCSALSIDYAPTVSTRKEANCSPATTPPGKWHVMATCSSERIRRLDWAEAVPSVSSADEASGRHQPASLSTCPGGCQ